jgi:hypothetical protein
VNSDPGPQVYLPAGSSKELGFGDTEEKLTTELYRRMLTPLAPFPAPSFYPTFWLMGDILYRDTNAIVHRMAFCRRYNPDTKRFEIEDDPDYEYSG